LAYFFYAIQRSINHKKLYYKSGAGASQSPSNHSTLTNTHYDTYNSTVQLREVDFVSWFPSHNWG